jgi:hypothetical protein
MLQNLRENHLFSAWQGELISAILSKKISVSVVANAGH